MNIKNVIISVLLILTIFISSCNVNNKNNPQPIGSTSTSSIGAINGVQVENPEFPERRVVGNAENIELPNCFGSADLTRTLGTQTTITNTTNVGSTATTSTGAEVEIPATAKFDLELEVGKEYSEIKQSATSRLDTAVMTAAPGTHIIYVIEWKEIEYKSLVRFTSNNEVYSVDYSYKLIVPDIVSNKALPCTSDVSPAPTNTPLADLQIQATAHLPSDVELNGTLNIWDFIQEEDLYNPGTRTYSINISSQQPYRWGAIWCGKDGNYLKQIMTPLDMQLWIDNMQVPSNQVLQYETIEYGTYCHRWATIVSGWPIEKTTILELRYSVAYSVFDGWDTVNPGQYKQIINVIALH